MAKRRTKEQKIHARMHFPATSDTEVKKTTPTHSAVSLYAYDPSYLKQDLRKTIIISTIILAIQIGLYIWLR